MRVDCDANQSISCYLTGNEQALLRIQGLSML